MLHELRVENLLLMEHAELRLAPGLNVLTGETGAGKTLLAHALDLLLGGKARSGIVRPGAAEAYVEGVFSLPPGIDAATDERIRTDCEELVLARRVWPDGRTRAYVCGRAATVADLRELGGLLLAFYGQHEHRKLMLSGAQLEILDAYCGSRQLDVRERVRDTYGRVRKLTARVEELRALAGARERELDLLAFELDEIEAANPSVEEADELTRDRDRLRNLEALRGGVAGACELVAPEEGGGAVERLADAASALDVAAALDPSLSALAERLAALRYEAEDAGGELRGYLLALDGDGPGRLEEIEERLALFARLERKHGGTIAEVLAHAERCRARRAELDRAEVSLEDAEHSRSDAQRELDGLAGELRSARAAAAPKLAVAVRKRLADLAMADASFELQLASRPDGCGPTGADTVELLIAPNAGVPAAPLREIGSGGELSRVMLALLSVAHSGPAAQTGALLVFDEVDAGIGGHTARAVGEHLRALAAGRQILCITHLPQVASLAQRHFRIVKQGRGEVSTTAVEPLTGEEIVSELVRMLGAGEDDQAAGEHARSLLRAA
ncbi:MAG TPA: DNA repair protein RecN [Solirubrobacteraceae bacterium]|nr:DNA repair protein RecN [Solirubrobacteraceae bacterium]